MKPRIYAILIALFVGVSLHAQTSGTCGDSLTWSYSSGVLTISGTGMMDQYIRFDIDQEWHTAPWNHLSANITSIVLPQGLRNIGRYAFFSTNITSIEIPNSVEVIEEGAFWDCVLLDSIIIPNSVKEIWWNTFHHCINLHFIKLPNRSDISIYSMAFAGCSNLPVENNIRYADYYLVEVIDKAQSEYTIKEETKFIGTNAFYGCNNLTSIVVPDNVMLIEDEAFRECVNLTSAIIGNNVKSIGTKAFFGCSNLTTVVNGGALKEIKKEAFSGCGNLSNINIPNTVTRIFSGVFDDCNSLPIENGIKYADTYAVNVINKALTSYSLKPSTRFIGNCAFLGCKSVKSITIPNGVICIGGYAFAGCDSIKSFTLPENIEYIEQGAFNCGSLDTIFILAEEPIELAGAEAFPWRSNLVFFVPCGTIDNYRTANNWTRFSSQIQYLPSPYQLIALSEDITKGEVTVLSQCDSVSNIIAIPHYGYSFTQWQDGLTDNPRDVELKQDTMFTAYFSRNAYSISTGVNNSLYGNASGDTIALYLDTIRIHAHANEGYYLYQWSDGSGLNPRNIVVSKDSNIVAIFKPYRQTVLLESSDISMGYVLGGGTYDYGTVLTITAVSNEYYHFVQWSDGITDNPRTIEVKNNINLMAEFAVDKSGTCGDDLLLTWTYDSNDKKLTIFGNGKLDSNMHFGVEALSEMTSLVVDNGVQTIGLGAFSGTSTLTSVSIGKEVTKINERAFYNCENLNTIRNYAIIPAIVYSSTFDGVNKFSCTLYVPNESVDMYKSASGWRDFYNIQGFDPESAIESISEESTTCKLYQNGHFYIILPDGTHYDSTGKKVK